MNAVDTAISIFFFKHHSLAGIYAAIGITELASPMSVSAVALAVSYVLYRKRLYSEIVGLLISVLGSEITVNIIKMIVARPRPLFQVYAEIGYAFPSAHAAAAAALYGYIAWVLVRKHRSTAWKYAVATMSIALIAAIALSRLYLDEHFFSDVIVGLCIGSLFAWLGMRYTLSRYAARR